MKIYTMDRAKIEAIGSMAFFLLKIGVITPCNRTFSYLNRTNFNKCHRIFEFAQRSSNLLYIMFLDPDSFVG